MITKIFLRAPLRGAYFVSNCLILYRQQQHGRMHALCRCAFLNATIIYSFAAKMTRR